MGGAAVSKMAHASRIDANFEDADFQPVRGSPQQPPNTAAQTEPKDESAQEDLAAHYRTYRAFVKYASLFALHVAVILALLAYFLV